MGPKLIMNSKPSTQPLIDMRDVVKVYSTAAGEFTALKGINLQVGSGEFVGIVGKSGAGKSTLLNALTESSVTAESLMFATLDPTSRRLRLPRDQEVIINDTVGFIRDLPPDLITAFRATLEEMEGSDLLIHLVDASNPQFENHIASVNKILDDLHLSQIPRLLVFNKADLLNEEELINLRRAFNAVTVSAMNRATLAPMLERIGSMLDAADAAKTQLNEKRHAESL